MMRQYHQTYDLNVGVRYYHMIRTIMNMSYRHMNLWSTMERYSILR